MPLLVLAEMVCDLGMLTELLGACSDVSLAQCCHISSVVQIWMLLMSAKMCSVGLVTAGSAYHGDVKRWQKSLRASHFADKRRFWRTICGKHVHSSNITVKWYHDVQPESNQQARNS